MEKMNDGLYSDVQGKFKCNIAYNYLAHQLNMQTLMSYVFPTSTMDMLLKLIYFHMKIY